MAEQNKIPQKISTRKLKPPINEGKIGLLPTFECDDFHLARSVAFRKIKKIDPHVRDRFAEEIVKLFYDFYPDSLEVNEHLPEGYIELNHVYRDDRKVAAGLLGGARDAFYFILQNLKNEFSWDANSEVIMPSFTCVVIVNPVLWSGLKPVFVDSSKKSFNNSLEGIVSAVTDNTKLILIQHTFGLPFPVLELKQKLKEMGREDIFLVEDLAHSLGESYSLQGNKQDNKRDNKRGAKLGVESDFAIMTFGVEKMISTVRGGAVLLNLASERLAKLRLLFRESYRELPELPKANQTKLNLNPVFWEVALKLYKFGYGKLTIGKALIWLAHRIGFLGVEIELEEYSGGKPSYIPSKLPEKQAILGLNQIEKLARFNQGRREIAKVYSGIIELTSYKNNPEQEYIKNIIENDLPHAFHRYPLLLESEEERNQIVRRAKKYGIVLGDWYKSMFYTKEEHLSELGYTSGDCPITEEIKDRIVNLPTSPNISEANLRAIRKILLVKGNNEV
ncbi:MAG: DegT/DnrJ/EryC1/StrS family aminotransferase [Candidatus Dojkabacteria bacterium]